MAEAQRTPLYRKDDNELLGFILKESNSWVAQTLFGYTIERTVTKQAAEKVLRETGLSFLTGTWQYFDRDEKNWFPCVINEASEHRVTVARTNAMGYQDPEDYKLVVINNPTENTLIKS